jgi:hypothetical protein
MHGLQGAEKGHQNGCPIPLLLGPHQPHVAHMGDAIIHTEGERFDIREADGKLYVYDKEEDVKLAYLVQT